MPTTKLIRNLPRMKEILTVAAKFGFGEVLRGSKLGEFLGKFKKIQEVEDTPAPIRFRLALEALGPTFMKLGQVLPVKLQIGKRVPPAICLEPSVSKYSGESIQSFFCITFGKSVMNIERHFIFVFSTVRMIGNRNVRGFFLPFLISQTKTDLLIPR